VLGRQGLQCRLQVQLATIAAYYNCSFQCTCERSTSSMSATSQASMYASTVILLQRHTSQHIQALET
jgi:hypothetical protein